MQSREAGIAERMGGVGWRCFGLRRWWEDGRKKSARIGKFGFWEVGGEGESCDGDVEVVERMGYQMRKLGLRIGDFVQLI